MKDRVFSGADVSQAVAEAGRALGLAPDRVRYVVLDPGTPGGRGVGGTPARIAVLLEGAPGTAGGSPEHDEEDELMDRQPGAPLSPRVAMRAALRSLAEAAGIDVSLELEEGADATVVRVGGADRDFFLEEEGEVLRSLEHLFQRIAARGETRRLHVHCEGYREARDAALGAYARELAGEVRRDGRSRVTDPLNSYERRIVHRALTEEAGIRTFSVGEGLDRRVTIARNEGGDGPGEPEA